MSEPFTMWVLYAPFDKHGVPRMGLSGQSIREVVVFESNTFKRLLEEYPALSEAVFRVGTLEDSEP